MDAELEVEVGVPVATTVSGNDRISAGVLPAGRYATLIHTGHPSGLFDATTALLDWAAENGIAWQTSVSDKGEVWRARIEWYLTDPDVEPDMEKWQTELAFLVVDDPAA